MMAQRTSIEWTDATWAPVRGCTRPRWAGHIQLVEGKLDEPLRWRTPRMVFVNSMSDLFHEDVPFDFIAAVFGVMAAAQQHTFQILTKRPKRALQFFRWIDEVAGQGFGTRFERLTFCRSAAIKRGVSGFPVDVHANGADWPLPNVWLGVSAENQDTAEERLRYLVHTPAAVRFLSCEPLLGPVDLSEWFGLYEPEKGKWTLKGGARLANSPDWVIVGGESGPNARPMDPNWARMLRDQCVAAGVPFFFKQWGEWLPDNQVNERFVVRMGHPGAPVWAIDKPVTHISPGVHAFQVGKKRAGAVLDGREWREFPHLRGAETC